MQPGSHVRLFISALGVSPNRPHLTKKQKLREAKDVRLLSEQSERITTRKSFCSGLAQWICRKKNKQEETITQPGFGWWKKLVEPLPPPLFHGRQLGNAGGAKKK